MDKVSLFGFDIDSLEFDEAADIVYDWSRSQAPARRFVATPNVNHVVLHQHDPKFRDAYQTADLVLADGRYVVHVSRLLGRPLPACVNGSDLVPAVFDLADRNDGIKVFLLGGLDGVADRAAENIKERWQKVSVVGSYCPRFRFEESEEECRKIVRLVNEAKPDLLVVGISPPRQEIWIASAIDELDVNVAIGAGATIDYLAGAKTRAPRWMQVASLEWIHRIWTEPARLGPRYFRDGLKFIRIFARELRANSRDRSQEAR